MGLAAAARGDEACAKGIQAGICQSAQYDKLASFRLTGSFHPCKVCTVRDAAFPRKTHGGKNAYHSAHPRQGCGSVVLRRVTAVLDFNTLRNEAFATLLTAAANNVATGFGGHASPEAELVFPRALGWLISTFAHGWASINVRCSSPVSGSGRGI